MTANDLLRELAAMDPFTYDELDNVHACFFCGVEGLAATHENDCLWAKASALIDGSVGEGTPQ